MHKQKLNKKNEVQLGSILLLVHWIRFLKKENIRQYIIECLYMSEINLKLEKL